MTVPLPTRSPCASRRAASNRELSWLEFANRLLDLAADDRQPLLERVKFLAIFAEGLDEFFQVRVAGLDQVAAGLAPGHRTDWARASSSRPSPRRRGDRLGQRQNHRPTPAHDAYSADCICTTDRDDRDQRFVIRIYAAGC